MTDTLTKALSILTAQAASPAALEALVEAMEACLEGKQYDGSGVVVEGLVEEAVQPKHPLEDYQITEQDVGSLVLVASSILYPEWRGGVLVGADDGSDGLPYKLAGDWWPCAKPHLDTISLHFKPYHATPDSVAPDDLGEHFAVLWNDGEIITYDRDSNGLHINSWKRFEDEEDDYMIGYRPLKFVNPLKQDK